MIISMASLFNSPILPILKSGKNKANFMVDYYNCVPIHKGLCSHPSRPAYLIYSITKITDSIQSITSTLFADIDLVNTFCSVPISTASQLQFAFASEGTWYTFSRLPMEYLRGFAITHDLCRQYFHYIHLSPRTQVWRYIDNILFQRD